MENMLILVSVVLIIAGVILRVLPRTAPATATPTTGTATTPPAAGASSSPTTADIDAMSDPRASDEVKDWWEVFGYADATPNLIRCVVSGSKGKGRILRYISDQDLVSPWSIEDWAGKRKFGAPFITSLRTIKIDRVVRKGTQTDKSEPSLLSQLQATGVVERRGLMRVFPRPVYHPALDTDDGVRFNLISYLVIEVFDARPAFTTYNDSLLQTINELVSAHVSSQVIKMKWEVYKDSYAQNGNKFELDPLNAKLFILGVRALQHTVSDPEVSKQSPEVQAALEKVVIAKETAKARKEEARGESYFKIRTGAAEARVVERMAKAEATRFDELYKTFKGKGISDTDAIRMAQASIIAEVNAEAIGKLVYYGAGSSGVQLAIPGAGEKKK